MKKSKGFTILELLVVIAIIAVLAAIISVNVVQYIDKTKSAAIETRANDMSLVATEYFNANNTYGHLCDATSMRDITESIHSQYGQDIFCFDGQSDYSITYGNQSGGDQNCGTDKWYAYVEYLFMPNSQTWCVDSAGNHSINGQNFNTCSCQ